MPQFFIKLRVSGNGNERVGMQGMQQGIHALYVAQKTVVE